MLTVEEIIAGLSDEQIQVLKDTINKGGWGDGDEEFLNDNNETERDMMFGYCTNDAKNAGHFSGRKIAGLFRGIYAKLCPNKVGHVISHCSDWWGDGTGDMMFIRSGYVDAFEAWARN